jgi:hypothetical protein
MAARLGRAAGGIAIMSARDPAGGLDGDGDKLWGAEEIGRYLNRSKTQIYHLFETGLLDGAVEKFGRRTLVGSKWRLDRIFFSGKKSSRRS